MILDTNALSAIADADSSIAPVLQGAAVAAIPVVVLGEFRFGVLQSRRRADYEQWLEESLPLYRVLDLTTETSRIYARIRLELQHAGTPIPTNDTWIAALSREHSLPVLSRDRHFDRVKRLRRVSW